LQVVRFDDNRFAVNAGSHTAGGTVIYLIGRGNGLGIAASTLLSLGEVLLWEFVAEFHEKPSINDMVTNPLSALAVGEPFFALSEYFARGGTNGANQILSTVFSPFSTLSRGIDYQGWPHSGNLDRFGFARDVWHRFDLYTGLASVHWTGAADRSEVVFGGSAAIDTLPSLGATTASAGFFGPARITQLSGGLALGGVGMTGALFATRVSIIGYHAQALHLDDLEQLTGQRLLVTLTNSFEFSARHRPELPFDQIGSFGILGPTLEVAQRRGDLGAVLHLEALPDLAMVTSLAGDLYRQRFGIEGTKSVFARRNYYYAYGVTVGGQLTARYRSLAAGLQGSWERFASIEGVDRFQEQVTRDFHLVDGRRRAGGSLSWRPFSPAEVGVALEWTRRFGTIGALTASTLERRALVTLGLTL
jgi:hypothetical protein